MSSPKKNTLIEIIMMLYVILFLYTGISKLMDYSLFKEQITTSPLLVPVAPYVAVLLPWIEFATAVLLFVPKWRLKGLYASLVLMVVFTGYVIGILLFNDKLPCSCGGILQDLSWKQHLVFNGLFIALAITAIILQKQLKRESTRKFAGSSPVYNIKL